VQEPAAEDAHVIPAAPAAHARLAAQLSYTVRPGDTLALIAGRVCGDAGDYWALAYNNSVPNPDLIYAGEVFKVACQAAAQAVADRYGLMGRSPESPQASSPVHYVSHQSEDPAPTYHHSSGAVVTSVSGTYRGSGSMQSCIIARESGGNPRAVNPSSGAGGLYQFLPSTWQALGHSGLPENASIAEQNQAFAQEVAQGGYSAWTPYDGCLRVSDAVVSYTWRCEAHSASRSAVRQADRH
jgi:hypothetical protein